MLHDRDHLAHDLASSHLPLRTPHALRAAVVLKSPPCSRPRPAGRVGNAYSLTNVACLLAAGVLALFVLALSWFAAAIGIAARTPEMAQGIAFLVSFLPYVSSAFVPIHTMPSALQAVARNQPATAVIDTIRASLNGGHIGADAWHAVAWSVGIIVVSIALSGVLFRRRAR